MRVGIAVVLIAVLSAACGDAGEAHQSAVSVAKAARSLCGEPRPAPGDPLEFDFNRDAATRDHLAGVDVEWGVDDLGGTAEISVGRDTVDRLLQERFLSPDEYHNEGPTAWDIFRFMCDHPGASAVGYVVSPERPDYRTTLVGLSVDGPFDVDRFDELCDGADSAERVGGSGGFCWFD